MPQDLLDRCPWFEDDIAQLPDRGPRIGVAGPDSSAEALQRLDELVLKPRDGAGGEGIVLGGRASREELADVRARIEADPAGWIAQEPVALSTHPTVVDGRLEPRHVDLRPFVIAGRVLPGGLSRFAQGSRATPSGPGDYPVLGGESSVGMPGSSTPSSSPSSSAGTPIGGASSASSGMPLGASSRGVIRAVPTRRAAARLVPTTRRGSRQRVILLGSPNRTCSNDARRDRRMPRLP